MSSKPVVHHYASLLREQWLGCTTPESAAVSVCRSSPCNQKLNWTGLDRQLRLHAFQTTQPDRFGPIATCFEGDWLKPVMQVIPLKIFAHFNPILRRNGPELHELWPKRYVLAKSNFMQHLIIAFFWILDNFYCHKNFMSSYYTLHTIFHSSFYVPNIIKISDLISFYLLWLELKKTGLDQFQQVAVLFFWYFRIRQPDVVARCPFLGQKTGLDWTCEH